MKSRRLRRDGVRVKESPSSIGLHFDPVYSGWVESTIDGSGWGFTPLVSSGRSVEFRSNRHPPAYMQFETQARARVCADSSGNHGVLVCAEELYPIR